MLVHVYSFFHKIVIIHQYLLEMHQDFRRKLNVKFGKIDTNILGKLYYQEILSEMIFGLRSAIFRANFESKVIPVGAYVVYPKYMITQTNLNGYM